MRVFFFFSSLLLLTTFSWAKESKKGEETKSSKKVEEDPYSFSNLAKINMLYTVWALNQRGFLLGKDHPLDDADYVVQMLRINLQFGTQNWGIVTRFDAAQGWWGVDNNPDNTTKYSLDKEGKLVATPTNNPYALFRNKDTNYTVHFDLAFLYVQMPFVHFPLRLFAGRQYFEVGNQLVLDYLHDGFKLQAKPAKWFEIEAFWAHISQGKDSTQFPMGSLMSANGTDGSSDLIGVRAFLNLKKHKIELYGLHYMDTNEDGNYSYLPMGLGYFNSRFRPNLSSVTAIGLAAKGKLDVLQGFFYKFEASVLFGKDNFANTNHVNNLLDINDGELFGYNVYLNLVQKFKAGIPFEVGVTFGMGSGDNDPRSGKGNINKIQTMGNFGITNVWEDSVMPDIGGISPQGLGSPVSRGYREFENTIAAQFKVGANLYKSLKLEASYTYLHATQPVYAFNEAGPTGDSDQNLGQEVDVNLSFSWFKGHFQYKALFGVFFPGKAAGYLINGTDRFLQYVWEMKQVLIVKY